jgi:phage baseplate assembly protein W
MVSHGFLGTGWAFPPAFHSRNKQAAVVSEHEDIVQSLHILLGTRPGERVMQPTFGCGLDRMVFERVDESTLTEIRDIVDKAVLFFEPRITLDAVEVDVSRIFEGVLMLNLAYTVRSTNTRSNLVYPLYLREGTDVGQRP